MTDEERDDALSWAGDDDRIVPPARGITPPRIPAAAPPQAHADAVRSDTDTSAQPASQVGNVALVALGLLGGVYLIEAIGWIIGGLRIAPIATTPAPNGFGLEPVGFFAAMWLAVLAPLIWYSSVYVLTRHGRAWLRFTLLVAGLLVFLPWPFLMVGVIGR